MTEPTQADAFAVLARDEQALQALIAQLRQAVATNAAEADRSALAGRIGLRLAALATLERELVEPRLPAGTDVARSNAAHDAMRAMAERLAATEGADAVLSTLADTLAAHGDDMRQRLLPLLRGQDTTALGAEIASRRQELLLDEAQD